MAERKLVVMNAGGSRNVPTRNGLAPAALRRGNYVVSAVSPEGWIALLSFGALAVGDLLGIWMGLVLPGHISVAMAVVFAVMIECDCRRLFVMLVQLRMTPRRRRGRASVDATGSIRPSRPGDSGRRAW